MSNRSDMPHGQRVDETDGNTTARDENDAITSRSCSEYRINPDGAPQLLTKAADDVYNMGHRRRGVCVIVNQTNFLLLDERRGSDVDARLLEKTFKALSFDVYTTRNLKLKKLHEALKYWQEYDHSNCDAFVFCYLSHGERDFVYHYDGKVSIDLLFAPFAGDQCPSLLGKPKLFFIQACRGASFDKGALVRDEPDSACGNAYRIPSHADFLICFSVVPGYYSWRNTEFGSWFIQALCAVFSEEDLIRDLDVLTLMTLVNKRMALHFESFVPGNVVMDKCKQVPFIAFTLTRKLFFSRKRDNLGRLTDVSTQLTTEHHSTSSTPSKVQLPTQGRVVT